MGASRPVPAVRGSARRGGSGARTGSTPPIAATAHRSWAWRLAGVAFVVYPALRPYADAHPGPALDPLAAMATERWLVAHLVGMAGFALLPVAFGGRAVDRAGRVASALAYVGTVGVLPYYGGESFGLHAIGARAVGTADPSLGLVVDGFRNNPVALTLFGLGLLAYAAAGIALSVSTRDSARPGRIAAALLALGLVLYGPQFFAGPPVRIVHGVLVAIGCWAVGLRVAQGSSTNLPRT